MASFSMLTMLTQSLRVQSRLPRTYVLRVLLIIATIVIFSFIGYSRSRFFQVTGMDLFWGQVIINIGLLHIFTFWLFSSAIAEEKEDGTLGLLVMTRMDPLSIILGKVGGRLTLVLMIIMLQIPFATMLLVIGGISFKQILAFFLTFSVHTILFAAMGTFVSVIMPRSRAAGLVTGIAIGIYDLAPLLKIWVRSNFRYYPGGFYAVFDQIDFAIQKTIGMIWHFKDYGEILSIGYKGELWRGSMTLSLLLSVFLFLLARLVFFWVNHDFEKKKDELTLSQKLQMKIVKGKGRAWRMAFVWKDFHLVSGGSLIFFLKVVTYGLLISMALVGGYYQSSSRRFMSFLEHISPILFWLFSAVVTIEISLLLSSSLRLEIDSNTFSTLRLVPRPFWLTLLSKLVGALVCALPGLFICTSLFLTALLLGGDLFGNSEIDGAVAIAGLTCFVSHLIVTSFLSIWLARGPFVISLVANFFCWVSYIFVLENVFLRGGHRSLLLPGLIIVVGLHIFGLFLLCSYGYRKLVALTEV